MEACVESSMCLETTTASSRVRDRGALEEEAGVPEARFKQVKE